MNGHAYVRVSSRSQPYAMQRSAIEKAAAARGDTIVDWYAEKESSKTMARPALLQLRADARAGVVRRLYVYRLDRLSRTGIRDTFDVVEELRAHGVTLITLGDGFDMDSPAAEIILAVLAWAAKMERLAINERISAARTRIEAEGGHWGRARRLTDAEVAQVLSMRQEGRTVRQVAIALKVPKSTVSDAIKRVSGKAAPTS